MGLARELSSEIPGWVPPEYGGGVTPISLGGYNGGYESGGGGVYTPNANPVPQTLSAPNPSPMPPIAADNGNLKFEISDQTLIIGGIIAAVAFFFAAK